MLHFLLKLFLHDRRRTIEILKKDVRSALQFIRGSRTTRLKCAVHRLSHQICKLLVRKCEFVWDQWRNEEKSYKNGAKYIHLCLQAEISTHQIMFTQKF